MKPLAFFTGFLFLTTAMAAPLFLRNKFQPASKESDDNDRHNVDDSMAAEGL